MTDTGKYLISGLMMLAPLLTAIYYRSLAIKAFTDAKTFAPVNRNPPSAMDQLLAAFFAVKRGGGAEFVLTPDWMAGVNHKSGRQHIADFKRYRFMFWLFMGSLPFWSVLVKRLFWQ
jgi:hypothetical protein